ncbi:MAG: hypothetical protein JJU42_05120 [Rhodobacteraceae bacterium]|nr:hypothetical protein [Paracoccaceae bacterium]
MISRLHSGAALALALALALASVTSAMARGQAPVAGWAVICTAAGGAVTIALDARGNPTAGIHPCPDCTLPALTLAGAWPATAIRTHGRPALWPFVDQGTAPAPERGRHLARAPPGPV